MTCSGFSRSSASRNRFPALIRGISCQLAQERLHSIALLLKLLQRRVHALAREIADLDALHDLVLPALAGNGIAVQDPLGNAIAAIGRNAHRDPVGLAR